MQRRRSCFGTEKIGSANLRSSRPECKCSRDASPVGNAASGDDRHANRIDDLRKQSHRARLRGHCAVEVRTEERRTLSSRLIPLGDDYIDAAGLEPPRLLDRVVADDMTKQPAALTRLSSGGAGKPK